MKKIIVAVLICCMLSGCSSDRVVGKKKSIADKPVVTPTASVFDTVKMSTIEAPEFNSIYAILYTECETLEVDWGASEKNSFFSEYSALPGFGNPMLIFANAFTAGKDSSITLETDYGSYNYVVLDDIEAVPNDNLTNVIDKISREEFINFYSSKEELYVFDVTSGRCFRCGLTGGTRIDP